MPTSAAPRPVGRRAASSLAYWTSGIQRVEGRWGWTQQGVPLPKSAKRTDDGEESVQADLPRVLKQPVRGDGQPGTLGELRLRPTAAEPLSAYALSKIGGSLQWCA
ncbi:MAG: hypothetical protein Q8K55_11145 [Gemmatimonadaceae bacterium]|nr:hypothetical protein [Gemmatimonadaceae bacterium]